MPAHAAIRYQAASFDTRVGKMMGRQRAGETFLRAWIDHAGADPITAWTEGPADAEAFAAQVRALGAAAPLAIAGSTDVRPLRAAGALLVGDPSVGRFAWQRRWFGQSAWSLIGITHTLSSAQACDTIAELLTAPVQPWDALICTSTSIRAMVRTGLEAQAEYLAARLGARSCTGPELPVIPLGVHCDAHRPDPAARKRWRDELGLGPDDIAILQFGRIGLHAKAHPLPLYRALTLAAERTGRTLHLLMVGQFINDTQDGMYRALAADFAPCVTTHFIDGARADAESVRAAADIGVLLADSIQESFGLAPVELMAAGLPVVASDWDGLRDTVAHGVTGFRIDTVMPPPGAGALIARRGALGVDDDDAVLGAVGQAVAIDIAAAADAFAALVADPSLRATMGEAGRRRAAQHYDWPVVIAAYRTLLDTLAERRRDGRGERAAPRPGGTIDPARMDPFAAFAGHATRPIGDATLLSPAPGAAARLDDLPGGHRMVLLAPHTLPPPATIDAIIGHLATGPTTLADLRHAFPEANPAQMANMVGWLLKFGFATAS